MIDVNVANFITVGLMAVIFIAVLKFVLKKLNVPNIENIL